MSGVAEASSAYLSEVTSTTIPVGYKQTEVGIIPSDWEVRTLEQLVAFRNGAAHENCIDDSGDYVVVNSKFISTEGLTRKGSKECRQPAYQSELLMVMSDVPNGRAIAKCYLVEANDTYTVNQRICALKCTGIEARFLFYKLNRNPFYLAFDDGAKQTNLRRQDVLDCPIPVPPKSEQTAIANALSDVDALISEQEKLIAKKQAIKTATMQQLLTGRTRLPQFALREDGTPKGTKPSELGEIPEDWAVFSLLDIANLLHGKAHEPYVAESGKYVVVNSKFVSTNGKVRKYCSQNDCAAKKGDILMVLSDLPNGKALAKCFYADQDEVYAVNQRVCIFRTSVFDSKYLQLILNRHKYFLALDDGVTQTHILNGDIAACQLFAPFNREEQTAIATILSDMDAEIQALEQRLGKTRQIKQGMMQELLTGKTRLIKGESHG